MKRRAAPTVDEIEALAVDVNRIALGGQVAEARAEVMDQIYSAVPGAPGAGLQIFEAALHARVRAYTTDCGAWRFSAQPPSEFDGLNRTVDGSPAPNSEVKRREISTPPEGEGWSPPGSGAFATPATAPLREAHP